MKNVNLSTDTIVMVVSLGSILVLVGSLVYAIATGQVDVSQLN